jgi:glycosyltransferase involved in cell wall biosynthesis
MISGNIGLHDAPVDDVAIVIPVFNDWESLSMLLTEIDATLGTANLKGRITVVDDGSSAPIPDLLRRQTYQHLSQLEVVRLSVNQGHQRAIAIGIAHLNQQHTAATYVVVMDGDGEDRADHIPRLFDELTRQNRSVVFGARTQRSEGNLFRLMYAVFRLFYRLLTGASIRFGNFSAMRSAVLPALSTCPDLWNHYAAAVVRSRLTYGTVPLARGKRYKGESRMGYIGLIAHGLSSISVFADIVGTRLMIFFSGLLACEAILIAVEIALRPELSHRFFLHAIDATGILILFSLQSLLISLLFTLAQLGGRSSAKVVPSREAPEFVLCVEQLFPDQL